VIKNDKKVLKMTISKNGTKLNVSKVMLENKPKWTKHVKKGGQKVPKMGQKRVILRGHF